MGWTMDSHGNWTKSGGSGNKNSESGRTSDVNTITDRGNTSDTNKAIANTTTDKTNQLKYAEEANFETLGDYQIQRGGYLNIGDGVADRWKGEWLILETTHTVNSRGYVTSGVCSRKPYYEETKDKSKTSKSSSSENVDSSTSSRQNDISGNSGSSGGKWVMDPDGTWHKK